MPVKHVEKIMPAALNTAEAAKYIGSSKSELDKARISGLLSGVTPPKFFRIGKKIIRYRIVDLDDWLKSQQTFITLANESLQKREKPDKIVEQVYQI